MASGKKNSSSRNRSASSEKRITRSRATKRASSAAPVGQPTGHFAICIQNDGYEASLELLKLYPVLEDEFASQHGMIRVIDESKEDYLFPNEYFVAVDLPQAIEKRLQRIA